MRLSLLLLTWAGLSLAVPLYASPILNWSGTHLNDIERDRYLGSEGEGRLVRINLRAPGIGAAEASQECGAGIVFVHEYGGSVAQFRVISERLFRLPIEQYFFNYQDRNRRISRSAV